MEHSAILLTRAMLPPVLDTFVFLSIFERPLKDRFHCTCILLQIIGLFCRNKPDLIWATSQENLSSGVGEQQRRRPACASAQSDQCLCYSLFRKDHMEACYEGNFNFLASLCSWGDLFETRFVGNPKDRYSRVAAHMIVAHAPIISNWTFFELWALY